MASMNLSGSHLPPPKIPRIESLQHQLQNAKDSDGHPIPLLDELFFFLDDPPSGTRDRWQAGADLCHDHGIKTSRMSVWRLYRAHILQWRREQNPAPPAPAPSPEETTRLQEEARHLAAGRVLETLNDPRLSPGHLIGVVQNENHRRQLELARDRFTDRLAVRERLERRQHLQQIEKDIRDEQLFSGQMEFLKKFVATLLAIPPRTTS